MKNIKVFSLAILAVIAMFYIGANGLTQNLSFGPFFIFVAACTSIGLSVDLFNHVSDQIRDRIRKSNLRKLQP